jgi:protein O-mannosyl-transferase
MIASENRPQKWLVCALLGAAVLAVFWPALQCAFTAFDDGDYVTLNPNIQHGLNGESIRWAMTTGHAANWHPLTWISHILDYQLYSLNPMGHHLTSLLLHAANAVLLLLLLNRMTGALWPSAFVAAMFALHPLRVESVVWVAERKDVLSTFFWMLTVWSYIRYAEEFKVQGSKFKVLYGLCLVFFVLGLMSKPMLVTLPFVLLLLDYWPLGRWEFGAKFSWRLIVEKIPFFLLAAGDSMVTFLVQQHGGAMATLTRFPFNVRLANIPFVYMSYMGKNFWPVNLAVFYAHRPLGLLEVGGALGLLGVVTLLAMRRWREQPYLAVGWFWFLGMLVPTIGLVQVGYQAMADRYSYLPSVGLWIMVAWGVRDWAGTRSFRRTMAALIGGAALVACVVLTLIQIRSWQDSRTLFTRAAAVTDQNFLAYYNLGCDALDHGDYPQAIASFKLALGAESDRAPWANHARAYNNLGYAYLHEGQITNAVASFEKALALQPSYPEAYYNMGRAFLANRQPDVALDCFQRALALDPNPVVLGALADAYAAEGNLPEAVAAAQRARSLALAQNNLSLAGSLESQLRRYQAGRGGSPP